MNADVRGSQEIFQSMSPTDERRSTMRGLDNAIATHVATYLTFWDQGSGTGAGRLIATS